jgi:hypothetical protein
MSGARSSLDLTYGPLRECFIAGRGDPQIDMYQYINLFRFIIAHCQHRGRFRSLCTCQQGHSVFRFVMANRARILLHFTVDHAVQINGKPLAASRGYLLRSSRGQKLLHSESAVQWRCTQPQRRQTLGP